MVKHLGIIVPFEKQHEILTYTTQSCELGAVLLKVNMAYVCNIQQPHM